LTSDVSFGVCGFKYGIEVIVWVEKTARCNRLRQHFWEVWWSSKLDS